MDRSARSSRLALIAWTRGALSRKAPKTLRADIFTQGLVAPNLEAEMDAPAETLAAPQAYMPTPVSIAFRARSAPGAAATISCSKRGSSPTGRR